MHTLNVKYLEKTFFFQKHLHIERQDKYIEKLCKSTMLFIHFKCSDGHFT